MSINNQKIKYNINDYIEKYSGFILKDPEFYEQDEGYKYKAVATFQKNFNIDAKNLAENIEKSLSDAKNLVQSGYYYPKKMLAKYAERDPKFIKEQFELLFDENINIAGRIDEFIENVNKKFKTPNIKSFIDYRFLSFFLSAKYPEKYFYTKSSDYRQFAQMINYELDLRGTQGEKYQKLLELAEATRGVLSENKNFLKVHQSIVKNFSYQDPSLSWGTYDFIFNVSRERWQELSKDIVKRVKFRNNIGNLKEEEYREILESDKFQEDLNEIDTNELLKIAKEYIPPKENYKNKLGEIRMRVEDRRQKEIVKKLNGFKCQICSFTFEWINANGQKKKFAHADHIIEKANGGDEKLENLLVLCPNHHAMKTLGVIIADLTKKELKINNQKLDFTPGHLKEFGW